MSREWMERALCADPRIDSEVFFARDATAARRICNHCAVKDDCLLEALLIEEQTGEPLAGTWGGLVPAQRRRVWSDPSKIEGMRRVRYDARLKKRRQQERAAAAAAASAAQPEVATA